MPVALEEKELKDKYIELNNQHNLTKVYREKGEQGIFTDYPHFYRLKLEGKNETRMYATRNSENGEFILSCYEVYIISYHINTGNILSIW